MILESERIYIRALEPDDYRITWQWHQNKEIWNNLVGHEYLVSEAFEKQWVEKTVFDTGRITGIICLKATDEPIGMISLFEMDFIYRSARISIIIGVEKYYGQGYGVEAMKTMIRFAMYQRNINRISYHILMSNRRSINHVCKCGAKLEGVMRQAVIKNGKFEDVAILSVLREDFDALENT